MAHVTHRFVMTALVLTAPVGAAQESQPEEQRLAALAKQLNDEAGQLYRQGRLTAAVEKLRRALEIHQRLYPASAFPDGHPDLAASLNNLGTVLNATGQAERALEHLQQSLDMRRKLFPLPKYPDGHPDVAATLSNLGTAQHGNGQAEKALAFFQQSLNMRHKLYPTSKYPDGHTNLAISLNSLGGVLQTMGQAEKALDFYQQGLDMRRKLFPASKYPDGHPDLARSLNNVGAARQRMGQAETALDYYQQCVAMARKLFPEAEYPDGHPDLALGFSNLGSVFEEMGHAEKALAFFQQSLDMKRKLYPAAKYSDGHSDLARNLNAMGSVLEALGQAEKALDFFQQSLDMRSRLFPESKYPDGHLDLAASLNNLGFMLQEMGHAEKALVYYRQSLDMHRKLLPASQYPDGHPNLAGSLSNLGGVLLALGHAEKALDICAQAVHMQQKLAEREMVTASESAALDLIAELRRDTSHGYFSVAVQVSNTEADSYAIVWNQKGAVQRLLSRRRLAASALRHQSPEIRQAFERLGEVQRTIGRLLNNPGQDLAARNKRLTELADERDRLTRELARAQPAVQRVEELAALLPRDLLELLPAHTVLIDFVRYGHLEKAKFIGHRYLAFVLAAGKPIRRVELGDAAMIDEAIASWRKAIESRKESAAPTLLRERVWDKLAQHLPAGTKTLYLSPDGDLARLPWAGLPIAKDRLLLEDYAVSLIPHGRFLLEQLKYPPKYTGEESVLALGNVDYGQGVWPPLPGTQVELNAIAALASVKRETASGAEATAARISANLPKARYAHLATHGFFDAAALTAEKKREAAAAKNRARGDNARIKLASKNPLAFTGLVLSDGEVYSGLNLVDLPLENLKLVTLSACETGLGEYTTGEGVQGLQRAFHIAGCPNVVASLWKVDDTATAALMTKFYHELWVNKKPPIEALREAQLTIYRHPELIPSLSGERGRPELDKAVRLASSLRAGRPERADTKLWAAFVLSGVGK